jgi:hypothetical protein
MKKQTLLFAALYLVIGSAVLQAYGQTGGESQDPVQFYLGRRNIPGRRICILVGERPRYRPEFRRHSHRNHVTGRSAGEERASDL